MKKTLWLISFIFLNNILVFGQEVAVGLSSTHDFYFQSPFANRNMYGLQFQYFVGKRVSLNNRLLFGKNKFNEKVMIHYGLGGLFTQASLQSGVIFISGNFLQDLAALVVLPILIPEGVQFHLGGERMQVSPYIYPASFEYNVLDNRDVKALLEVGTQFKFIQKDGYFIAPSIAWKMRYGDKRQAFSVGFMIGFSGE